MDCNVKSSAVRHLFFLLSLWTSPAAAQELRGRWVDAFNTGFKTSGQVTQLIADVRASNVHALFVQVWKRGDAY